MSVTREVEASANRIMHRIIENQKSRGFRASGRSAQSLRYVITDRSLEIWGAAYFEYQERGSAPWKRGDKPPRWFVAVIARWIRVKGIGLNPFAVAHAITNRGSLLYRGGRKELGIEGIANEEAEKLATEIAENLANDLIVNIEI